MHNILKRIIGLVFSVALFLTLFFTAINIVVYNEDYYRWHYENRNIEQATGMNIDDLMKVTKVFIDYLQDKRNNINVQATIHGQVDEVFGEREKAHMVDVKTLAVNGERIRVYGGLFVLLVLFLAIYKDKRYLRELLAGIKYVFLVLALMIMGIGALLITDFNKYFTIFHELFFSNDLWLLDPQTDVLINMVPEIFFFTTAMLVMIIFIVMIIITIVCAEIIRKKILKKFRSTHG